MSRQTCVAPLVSKVEGGGEGGWQALPARWRGFVVCLYVCVCVCVWVCDWLETILPDTFSYIFFLPAIKLNTLTQCVAGEAQDPDLEGFQSRVFRAWAAPLWPAYSISRDFLSSPSPPSARLNPLHRTYRLRTLPSSRTAHILTLEGSLHTRSRADLLRVLSQGSEVCQWVFNGWRWVPPAAPDWTPVPTYCRWTSRGAMAPRCHWKKSVSSLSSSFTTTGWRTRRFWTGGRPYSSISVTRRRSRVSLPVVAVPFYFSTCHQKGLNSRMFVYVL